MNLAEGYERRFGIALGISVVAHIGAMTLSSPAPLVPAFDAPIPLSVRLVQEPLAAVVELVRPARPAASKPAHAKHAPPKHEEARPAPSPAPQPLPPIAAPQAVPPIDETPATAPEPAAPPPVAATLLPTPEPVALAAPALPQRGPSAELLALYTKSLSELFARYKEYPQIAQLRGWEGSVTMRLRVAPSGRLIGAEVLKSSGYEALDKQAMTMVSKAGALPVPPEGLNLAEFPVLVPINFRLER